MKVCLPLLGLLLISSTTFADIDYGLQLKEGTRISSSAVGEYPIWSIDDATISKQDSFRATVEVKATIANGICGASEVHSKLKNIGGATESADGLTEIFNFGMSIVATGSYVDLLKACYTSSSGPIQVVIEVPVEISSTDPKKLIRYVFSAGKSSFAVTGQFGKKWTASKVQLNK
jgi:hypothetical protein